MNNALRRLGRFVQTALLAAPAGRGSGRGLRLARSVAGAIAVAMLALGCLSPAAAQAGTASANLNVQLTITASCTINAATLTFPTTAGTSLLSAAVSGSTTVAVTCTNGSPYAIGMDNGQNVLASQRRMASAGNYIPYNLYVDAAHTQAWTTAATNSTCTTSNSCALGTGSGASQSVNIYGSVPTVASAPTPGTYLDTVVMTITY